MSKSLHKVPYISREVLIKSFILKREEAKAPKDRKVLERFTKIFPELPVPRSGARIKKDMRDEFKKYRIKNKRQAWGNGISRSKFRRRKVKKKKKGRFKGQDKVYKEDLNFNPHDIIFYQRNSTIPFCFCYTPFSIHTGVRLKNYRYYKAHLGFKVGEFTITRKKPEHQGRKAHVSKKRPGTAQATFFYDLRGKFFTS